MRIEPLGDAALLIRLGERIDVDLNRRAHALAAALRAAALPGIIDITPAYASVGLRYDIAACAALPGTGAPLARLIAQLEPLLRALPRDAAPAIDGAVLEVPVCYGGRFGADLDAVAAHAGLDARDVVALHAQADYRVAMLGFMPGFAYLLGLDERLHTPRRPVPRTRVPAGSVAIGGAQTGIYPRELPGGWQLIGRTPLTLFDPRRSPPALLEAGRRVRFRAIDADEFSALSQ